MTEPFDIETIRKRLQAASKDWNNPSNPENMDQNFHDATRLWFQTKEDLKAALKHIEQWNGAVPQSAYDSILKLYNQALKRIEELETLKCPRCAKPYTKTLNGLTCKTMFGKTPCDLNRSHDD